MQTQPTNTAPTISATATLHFPQTMSAAKFINWHWQSFPTYTICHHFTLTLLRSSNIPSKAMHNYQKIISILPSNILGFLLQTFLPKKIQVLSTWKVPDHVPTNSTKHYMFAKIQYLILNWLCYMGSSSDVICILYVYVCTAQRLDCLMIFSLQHLFPELKVNYATAS